MYDRARSGMYNGTCTVQLLLYMYKHYMSTKTVPKLHIYIYAFLFPFYILAVGEGPGGGESRVWTGGSTAARGVPLQGTR